MNINEAVKEDNREWQMRCEYLRGQNDALCELIRIANVAINVNEKQIALMLSNTGRNDNAGF